MSVSVSLMNLYSAISYSCLCCCCKNYRPRQSGPFCETQYTSSSPFNLVCAVILKVLRQDAKNGFALVHLGFIVKTSDRDYAGAIPLLQEGISSNVPGVIDGRFFFHLGDALFRTGQHDEVLEIILLTAYIIVVCQTVIYALQRVLRYY